MFCTKCGKQIPEGTAFCSGCGTAVPQKQAPAVSPAEEQVFAAPVEETVLSTEETVIAAPVEEVQAEAPQEEAGAVLAEEAPEVEEVPAAEEVLISEEVPAAEEVLIAEEAPAAEEAAQAEPFAPVSFEAPKKKKKSALAWLIPLVAVLAAAAVAVALFFEPIVGFCMKNIASPEAYLQYVESKSVADDAASISEQYGIYLESLDMVGDMATETKVTLQVDETVMALLQSGFEDLELAWINDVVLDMDVNAHDGKNAITMQVNVGEEMLTDMVYILDAKEQKIYFALPSLNEKYLMLDMSQSAGTMGIANMDPLAMNKAVAEMLPAEQVLEQLLNKYSNLIVKQLKDVEKSTQTLTVDGISQEVTVLKCTVDEKTAAVMAKDTLTEAKNDKELEKLINGFAEFSKEFYGMEDEADELYADFQEAIDEALEEIAEDELDSEEVLHLTSFVDDNHKIIGRVLEFDGEQLLRYITLTDGEKFAVEVALTDAMSFRGEGTKKGNVINGKYVITMQDADLLVLTVTDLDTASMKEKGCLNGKFLLEFAEGAWSAMDAQDSTMNVIKSMNLGLFIEVSGNREKSEATIGVSSNGSNMVAIAMEGTMKETSEISMPAQDQVLDAQDYEAMEEWLGTLDLAKLEEAMENAGLPEALLDVFFPPEDLEPEYEEPNPVIAAYIEENADVLLEAMEASFATSSGMTCTSDIWVEGNGFVIQININEFDNIDEETKNTLQEIYDGMNENFVSSLEQMQVDLPELEYFMVLVCEVDGDMLAYILAEDPALAA